jgi:hypothetical protein
VELFDFVDVKCVVEYLFPYECAFVPFVNGRVDLQAKRTLQQFERVIELSEEVLEVYIVISAYWHRHFSYLIFKFL